MEINLVTYFIIALLPKHYFAIEIARHYQDTLKGYSYACNQMVSRRIATGAPRTCKCTRLFGTVMSPNRDIPWCNDYRTIGCRYNVGRSGTTYLMRPHMVNTPQHIYPKFKGREGNVVGVRVWYVNRNYAGVWLNVSRETRKYFSLVTTSGGRSMLMWRRLNFKHWEGHVVQLLLSPTDITACVIIKFQGSMRYPYDIKQFKKQFYEKTTTTTSTTTTAEITTTATTTATATAAATTTSPTTTTATTARITTTTTRTTIAKTTVAPTTALNITKPATTLRKVIFSTAKRRTWGETEMDNTGSTTPQQNEVIVGPVDDEASREERIEQLLTVVYVVPPIAIIVLLVFACFVCKLIRNRNRARSRPRLGGAGTSGGTLIVRGEN